MRAIVCDVEGSRRIGQKACSVHRAAQLTQTRRALRISTCWMDAGSGSIGRRAAIVIQLDTLCVTDWIQPCNRGIVHVSSGMGGKHMIRVGSGWDAGASLGPSLAEVGRQIAAPRRGGRTRATVRDQPSSSSCRVRLPDVRGADRGSARQVGLPGACGADPTSTPTGGLERGAPAAVRIRRARSVGRS